MRLFQFILFSCLLQCTALAQKSNPVSKAWISDNGNGTYKNPVINADYSDPDAIRVGDDFYMISSSFNAVPGLPILHSTDLVNWELIGHALHKQLPEADFNTVQHGNGVWAPAIRYHNGEFYIFSPDPDRGIYLLKAKNITGPWSEPILVEAGKGLIDPCPLWDDEGKVYLVHGYAGSRAGFKSIIAIEEMNAAADKVIGDAIMIYDGHEKDPTIEGPKIYKRNNYYYVFAPAGGVSTGWQVVLRSKKIYGPYERKVVMDQGKSSVNGPHQGAWVTTASGEDWFLNFQDKDAYGRVVHLQPMAWKNDWPVIGIDKDGDGIGEPVMNYKKPSVKNPSAVKTVQDSDEFNDAGLGLQWQWQANPQSGWAFPTADGFLRMFCIKQSDSAKNYWMMPNFLSQKLPAEEFSATVKLKFFPKNINDRTGLMLFGTDYAYISLVKKDSGNYISYVICKNADKGKAEIEFTSEKITGNEIYLKVNIEKGAVAHFSYSTNGGSFRQMPDAFTAVPGKWVGAKIGLFSSSVTKTNDTGYTDIDWFHIDKN
jgi:beta-xylosidase